MARVNEDVKKETRACIIKEAQRFFNIHGYEKTKTKDIAKVCGIAEGTLFNYFENKDEILFAVFDKISEEAKVEPSQHHVLKEDIIVDFIFKPLKKMTIFSKPLLLDLFSASMKLAKKRPKIFKKFMDMDLAFINLVSEKLELFLNMEHLQMTSLEFAESIYGICASEFLLFLYDEQTTFSDFEHKAQKKVRAILKPYL